LDHSDYVRMAETCMTLKAELHDIAVRVAWLHEITALMGGIVNLHAAVQM
jgi:hypothetical protein